VQQRRRHAPKAVAGHLIFRLAHAPERRQYGVLAHEPLSRLRAGKRKIVLLRASDAQSDRTPASAKITLTNSDSGGSIA
jgi:hypothetical protein